LQEVGRLPLPLNLPRNRRDPTASEAAISNHLKPFLEDTADLGVCDLQAHDPTDVLHEY
jgi:hypothetical protein